MVMSIPDQWVVAAGAVEWRLRAHCWLRVGAG